MQNLEQKSVTIIDVLQYWLTQIAETKPATTSDLKDLMVHLTRAQIMLETMNNSSTFDSLQDKIISWAHARNLIVNGDPKAQFLKTVSEIGELADGINKENLQDIQDGVGDILVTLIILCELYNTDVTTCLRYAYDQIALRTGKTVNGVFIKDEL